MTQTTPNTFIVGAGPVATAFAGALRERGVPVLGLWARNPTAARNASGIAGVASYSAAPPDLLLETDAVILAVRDDAVAQVAEMLLATGLVTRQHVLLHCSGARSAADAFPEAIRAQLGGVGTLHPLVALADGRTGMVALASAVFGVEGDERGMTTATALARALGGTPLMLSGEHMAAYHAAAAMASNFLVTLVDAASSLLTRSGMSTQQAAAALIPLARGSLDNIERRGAVAALTGPIQRGDVATVERHLATLSDSRALTRPTSPDLPTLYRALGLRTIALARRAGAASEQALDAIEALLENPTR